jgi:hypothetical protein
MAVAAGLVKKIIKIRTENGSIKDEKVKIGGKIPINLIYLLIYFIHSFKNKNYFRISFSSVPRDNMMSE